MTPDGPVMPAAYRDDLAYIHDPGYGHLARAAAPVLLVELRRAGLARGRVVDLGCGPADIPLRLARARPELGATAVDGAAAMLALAANAVRRAGAHVTLVRASVPRLPFRRSTFDAVVSNSLLHHLPDPLVLWRETARLVRPGGAILVMDLARPESPSRAREIVERYAADEAELLKRDFQASLLAAFTPEELRSQLAAILPGLRCEMVSDRHWLVSGRG